MGVLPMHPSHEACKSLRPPSSVNIPLVAGNPSLCPAFTEARQNMPTARQRNPRPRQTSSIPRPVRFPFPHSVKRCAPDSRICPSLSMSPMTSTLFVNRIDHRFRQPLAEIFFFAVPESRKGLRGRMECDKSSNYLRLCLGKEEGEGIGKGGGGLRLGGRE